jgi:hypothetical protein
MPVSIFFRRRQAWAATLLQQSLYQYFDIFFIQKGIRLPPGVLAGCRLEEIEVLGMEMARTVSMVWPNFLLKGNCLLPSVPSF